MSRGRALRTGIAYDMRSGMKTRGRRLQEDGERPGIYTERGWRDERHPSRYVNVPPPDGLNYRPGPPAAHAIGATIDLSWVMESDTSFGSTDSTTQQAFGVLRRAFAPQLWGVFEPGAFFVGEFHDLQTKMAVAAALLATLTTEEDLRSNMAVMAAISATLTSIGLPGQWDFTDTRQSGELLTSGLF